MSTRRSYLITPPWCIANSCHRIRHVANTPNTPIACLGKTNIWIDVVAHRRSHTGKTPLRNAHVRLRSRSWAGRPALPPLLPAPDWAAGGFVFPRWFRPPMEFSAKAGSIQERRQAAAGSARRLPRGAGKRQSPSPSAPAPERMRARFLIPHVFLVHPPSRAYVRK